MSATDHHSALVIAGAPVLVPDAYVHLISAADIIIAVDAGAELCRANGRMPDHLVGDFDSITPETLAEASAAGSTLHSLHPEKDFSDFDAALDLCDRLNVRRPLTVTAATGGRDDHFLGVIGTLARHTSLAPIVDEPHVVVWVMSPSGCTSLTVGPVGTTFSLLAVLGPATVSISGARYPLDHFPIEPLSTRGISNEVSEESAHISVHSGTVMVISSRSPDIPLLHQLAVTFTNSNVASL